MFKVITTVFLSALVLGGVAASPSYAKDAGHASHAKAAKAKACYECPMCHTKSDKAGKCAHCKVSMVKCDMKQMKHHSKGHGHHAPVKK